MPPHRILMENLQTGQDNKWPVPNYNDKASTRRLGPSLVTLPAVQISSRKEKKNHPQLPININLPNRNESFLHFLI